MTTSEKASIVVKGRWSSYMDDETDETLLIWTVLGHLTWRTNGRIGVRTTPHLRMMTRLQRDKKREKHWKMKRRMGCPRNLPMIDGDAKVECKERWRQVQRQMQRSDGLRWMRWNIEDRPSTNVGLDEMWSDWLKGLVLWRAVTGVGARSCGVGLGWCSVRRCLVPWNLECF